MLNRIKAWLDAGTTESPSHRGRERSAQLAAAALLVEAAREDGEVSDEELVLIRTLLAERFGLSSGEARALAEEGEAAQARSTGLFRFTRASVDAMDEGERERLVEMMWDVIYADDVVHDFEANLMRRICGLLHVSDRASGEARNRARQRRQGKG